MFWDGVWWMVWGDLCFTAARTGGVLWEIASPSDDNMIQWGALRLRVRGQVLSI